jgi:hypothetical protein
MNGNLCRWKKDPQQRWRHSNWKRKIENCKNNAPRNSRGIFTARSFLTAADFENSRRVKILCGVFGQLRKMFAMAFWRSDNLHLLPIIGKFLAAIETGNVGSGQRSGLRTAHGTTNRNGEAIAGVFATKNCIVQFSDHWVTFHLRAGSPANLLLGSAFPQNYRTIARLSHPFRFNWSERVSAFGPMFRK